MRQAVGLEGTSQLRHNGPLSSTIQTNLPFSILAPAAIASSLAAAQ